ncbi:restriction endonuclease subunit S [Vibrio cholerae]|uniref:restriction endonuclease subunit S n=1 Tax=Vibrio cholerae TaxID=666 RepID=UPI0004E3A304|nr:restriction endonuclease subunit S [Vibrio cholerae]KFE09566.1 type I restriction modification DNA specificity domain protein [Vibrio cholerae]TXZ80716.1 restriction endonuclease subunit S [Vibrio cholerae]GHZ93633.1 restriction modification system DNA specificity subunit [Vibrio cholerae]
MSFETATLESLCELVVDCPHSTPEWTDEGIIVLRNQNIKNGVLDLSSPSFTNEDDYQKRIKRAVPRAGDIVFTREAPMGEVCMVPEGLKCCLGQRQVLLRPKSDVNGQYLFWALQSPYVQQQIAWNEGTGSTVSNVRIPVLKALNIPRIGNEDMIAKSLTDIASKLSLNTQTNQTLEQMAQAIFKSWFVDFDPVKAKMNGEQPEGMDAATASLFPEKLVESELGLIPEGWEIKPIKDLCTKVQNGGTPKRNEKSYWDDGTIPWLTSGEVRQSIITAVENRITQLGLDKSSAKWVPELSTLVALYGATAGEVSLTSIPLTTNQAVCALMPKKEHQWYNYLQLKNRVAELAGKAVGSAQQNISKGLVESTEVLSVPESLLEAFNSQVENLFRLRICNLNENVELAKLRDTLLPKLLSGEIELGLNEAVELEA